MFLHLSVVILTAKGTGRQGCKSLLSIGGDNLQFYPIFNIGEDESRPRFFSGERFK